MNVTLRKDIGMKENIEYITMDSRAEVPMAKHLNLDDRKIKKIVDLKVKYCERSSY